MAAFGATNSFFSPGAIRLFGEEDLTGLQYFAALLHDYIMIFLPFLMLAGLAQVIQYLADIKWLLRHNLEGGHA
ncbi:hypothetical protein ACFFF7_07455 [Novosphingobium aquiterrae]|uniref:Uncharacterized protein n=1 Tax=Novosphingobium aquiterrae TaxID=624388 RepID=A0ABV6PHD0_9SPHN